MGCNLYDTDAEGALNLVFDISDLVMGWNWRRHRQSGQSLSKDYTRVPMLHQSWHSAQGIEMEKRCVPYPVLEKEGYRVQGTGHCQQGTLDGIESLVGSNIMFMFRYST